MRFFPLLNVFSKKSIITPRLLGNTGVAAVKIKDPEQSRHWFFKCQLGNGDSDNGYTFNRNNIPPYKLGGFSLGSILMLPSRSGPKNFNLLRF
jgi:hypothetical protein